MNIQIAKLILVGAIPLAFALGANAQERHILAGGVGVENISVERIAKDRMDITLDLDLSRLYLKSDKACLLTPVLTRGDKSLELPAVGLYSRGSFIQYLRGGRRTLSGNEKMTYSVKKSTSSGQLLHPGSVGRLDGRSRASDPLRPVRMQKL